MHWFMVFVTVQNVYGRNLKNEIMKRKKKKKKKKLNENTTFFYFIIFKIFLYLNLFKLKP